MTILKSVSNTDGCNCLESRHSDWATFEPFHETLF